MSNCDMVLFFSKELLSSLIHKDALGATRRVRLCDAAGDEGGCLMGWTMNTSPNRGASGGLAGV